MQQYVKRVSMTCSHAKSIIIIMWTPVGRHWTRGWLDPKAPKRELKKRFQILLHPFNWQGCHGSINVGNRITTTTVCCDCVFLPRPCLCCYSDTDCALYTRHFCNRYSNENLCPVFDIYIYWYINICDIKATILIWCSHIGVDEDTFLLGCNSISIVL